MKPLVTAAEMTGIDTEAQTRFGIPSIVLMEHAGLAMYRELLRRISGEPFHDSGPESAHELSVESGGSGESGKPEGKSNRARPTLLVVAGRGNNGGDGLVIARLAAIDGQFNVQLLDAGCGNADPDSQTGIHLASCRALGVPVTESVTKALSKLTERDWIVDAIAGTGIRGALRGEKADLIAAINSKAEKQHVVSHAPRVLSVDVPSGLGDEFAADYPAVRADVTITVGWHKRSMLTPAGRKCAGVIRVVDIFFPSGPSPAPALDEPSETGATLLEDGDAPRIISAVSETSHKGDRGHLAIFAGSPGTVGAAMLCSDAAVHARSGLVSLIADPCVANRVEGLNPSVMVHSAESPETFAATFSRKIDAALIGPGWGTGEDRYPAILELTRQVERGVLDADALTILANTSKRDLAHLSAGEWVATPHPGECARIAGCPIGKVLAAPESVIGTLAAEYGMIVVLKAAATWIATPQGALRVFDGAHRAGGVGGSGDILAGVIGAFMAGGATPIQAALSGVLTHSLAIRTCFSAEGWFSSADLPSYVGRVLAEVEDRRAYG